MSENGWSEYQRLVLHRLDDSEQRLVKIERSLSKLSSVAATHSERLAATAGVFGFFAGLVPVVLVLIWGK
jgi:VIT1/CCC1 family predicted Fe2+/Mn2+ transporter